MFFVYGYGGTGKTYLYKTMSAALRSKGDIVLNVASSGIVVRRRKDNTFTTLRDICRTDPSVAFDKVFGGKVVLFGGDFRQILPVITNGGRQDVLDQRNLTKKEIQEFADWILEIGNGKVGGANDGESTIVFPDNMLIPETDDDVGDENEYESSDSVCLADEDSNFDDSIYTTKFVNGLRMSGIPNHSIKLKKSTHIMLMRNINQRAGLCNGTRLQVLRLGINIVEAQIISGGSVGTICAIPRMVISPTDAKMLFKLNRRQFPIQVCFAMTINKSQGQTLSQSDRHKDAVQVE
nr:ATP-dependent DNA helicase PIF1-like [Tanacetum cinerariifolium]